MKKLLAIGTLLFTLGNTIAVGDIVFTDGTATAYHDGLVLSEAQKNACAAVIFYKGTACSNDGRERFHHRM